MLSALVLSIERCQRGDAVLNGRQGIIITLVFPNGDRRMWFSTDDDTAQQTVCEDESRVRKPNGAWLFARNQCWNDK